MKPILTTFERTPYAVVVTITCSQLSGDATARQMREEILYAAQINDEHFADLVVLDFQHVTLVSSSVIASLLKLRTSLISSGSSLRLCAMTDSMRHIFKTLRLDGTRFVIDDTLVESLAHAAHPPSVHDAFGMAGPDDTAEIRD